MINMCLFSQKFGPILDVEIIFNERGSKVRIHWGSFSLLGAREGKKVVMCVGILEPSTGTKLGLPSVGGGGDRFSFLYICYPTTDTTYFIVGMISENTSKTASLPAHYTNGSIKKAPLIETKKKKPATTVRKPSLLQCVSCLKDR